MLGSMLKVGRLPIGIDLGSGSVKLAQARSWSNPAVLASARVPFESSGITTMTFEEIRQLAREITNAAKHSGPLDNTALANVALPAPHSTTVNGAGSPRSRHTVSRYRPIRCPNNGPTSGLVRKSPCWRPADPVPAA